MQDATEQQLLRVLSVIADSEKEKPGFFTPDTHIAQELGIAIEDARAYMDVLAERGMTTPANAHDGHAAALKGRGRLAVKDPSFISDTPASTVQNIYSGDFRGTILNIGSVLHSVTQTIGSSPTLDDTKKRELTELVQQLQAELEKAPPDKADDAEAVAESAKDLVDAATREKPNKTRITVTAEGLKKAAENIAGVMPPVLMIATQIVELIR